MSDDDCDNGSGIRVVTIDTGFYNVTVQGNEDDPLETVLGAAEHAAEQAKADVQELDNEEDNGHYQ